MQTGAPVPVPKPPVAKAEHECKSGACPCPAMTKKRLKKSIDRLRSIMKRVESLDEPTKALVFKNVDVLLEKQESFLNQSITRLKKMSADFSDLPIQVRTDET
jgi:hypothetical protein